MSPALQAMSVACAAFGLLGAAAVLTRGLGLRGAVGVLLDFLLAAGLLRLADDPQWGQVATAAVIVLVRRLLSVGLAEAADERLLPRRRG